MYIFFFCLRERVRKKKEAPAWKNPFWRNAKKEVGTTNFLLRNDSRETVPREKPRFALAKRGPSQVWGFNSLIFLSPSWLFIFSGNTSDSSACGLCCRKASPGSLLHRSSETSHTKMGKLFTIWQKELLLAPQNCKNYELHADSLKKSPLSCFGAFLFSFSPGGPEIIFETLFLSCFGPEAGNPLCSGQASSKA